jgi:Zn-dependent protease with chaperone function
MVTCCLVLQLPLHFCAVAPRTGPGPHVLPRIVVSSSPQAAQSSSFSTAPPQQAYTLPPDKLVKAKALGRIRSILGLVGSVWSLAVLYLLLATRAAAGLEGWTQRIFRRRWLHGVLFFAALLVTTALADLPLDIYAHSVSLRYGISVQGWTGWSLDLAKGLGLSLLFGPPILLLFNWIVRRWPRRYWLGAWVVTLPLMLFSAFGEPLIEPIFNHYEPLAEHHPALVAQLEQVVARTGASIPPDRMYLMKASAKSNGLNAYVSGIGSTKRIVVWDTMADRIPVEEILFLCGHETGHYVLHHIPKGLAIVAVSLFFVYWSCAGFAAWLARRFTGLWGLNGLGNEAPLSSRTGFVVLLFTVSVAGFVLAPIDNAISRHFEHQADVYGQEAIHGIVSDPQKTAVAAFNALGEAWLEDPNPSPFLEFWTFDHPSTQTRATFAAHYNPWANGGHGQFFAK